MVHVEQMALPESTALMESTANLHKLQRLLQVIQIALTVVPEFQWEIPKSLLAMVQRVQTE
jgi:hypothetical protein